MSFGGAGIDPVPLEKFETLLQVVMVFDVYEFVIIQSGPEQSPVIHYKTGRFHNMETRSGIGAKSDDIAGI